MVQPGYGQPARVGPGAGPAPLQAGRSLSPLPAEHEGPVTSVRVGPSGLRVLSTTSSGHLGFLDVPSQVYSVLVRSHTAPVLALATEHSRGQLATVSQDHTVRVWGLATLQQVGCGQRGVGWEGGLEAAGGRAQGSNPLGRLALGVPLSTLMRLLPSPPAV